MASDVKVCERVGLQVKDTLIDSNKAGGNNLRQRSAILKGEIGTRSRAQ